MISRPLEIRYCVANLRCACWALMRWDALKRTEEHKLNIWVSILEVSGCSMQEVFAKACQWSLASSLCICSILIIFGARHLNVLTLDQ